VKTLSNETDKADVLRRLRQLQPDSQRRWGRMSPHKMVCHLTDSFKTVMGEREIRGDKSTLLTRTLVRWIALYAPLKWPHGVPTMPENDQEKGGTPPEEFKRDVDALLSMVERVTRPARDFRWHRHPLFAEMSAKDWMGWGVLARRSSSASIRTLIKRLCLHPEN
jgi:hypothetical protein